MTLEDLDARKDVTWERDGDVVRFSLERDGKTITGSAMVKDGVLDLAPQRSSAHRALLS